MVRFLALIVLAFHAASAMADAGEAPVATLRTDSILLRSAFTAAQWASLSDAASALQLLGARTGERQDRLGALVRERESLVARRTAIQGQFARMIGTPGADGAAVGGLAAQTTALDDALADVDARIAAADPAYADLSRPKALEVQAAQALLNSDEALLVVFVSDDAAYAFLVTDTAAAWTRITDLAEAKATGRVEALRATLQRDLAVEAPVLSFDRAEAYRLYRDIVAPFEGLLSGKARLITVTNGPLSMLPLHLLIARPPQGEATPRNMAQDAWLAERFDMASLPSVSSLRILRCALAEAGARHRGCTEAIPARPAPGANALLVAIGDPVLGAEPAESRGSTKGGPCYCDVTAGELAKPEILATLESLPGAGAELDQAAKLFGTDAHVLARTAATESAVKSDPMLPNAHYILLSTHALLAGEPGSPGEPGLVLTPPAVGKATARDDGFLAASEIAQLSLNARVVFLSACNTAGADGTPGGEGLSGLTRAFFYAGARNLVVSHWAVWDESTAVLTRTLLATLRADPKQSPAGALRRAMAQVRHLRPDYVSPAFWAPFVLVGL